VSAKSHAKVVELTEWSHSNV